MNFILFLVRIFALQLFFCQVFRILFILISPARIELELIFGSLWSGLKFDLGISMLVLLLLAVVQWILSYFSSRLKEIVFSAFFFLLILIQSFASIGDVILYKYWDSIFSVRAYPYLKNFSEMTKNISTFNFIFILFYLGLIGLIFFYSKKIIGLSVDVGAKWYIRVLIILGLIPAAFLSLRGGFREIPRNQSDGFFCDNRTYNIASINSTWNFFNVLIENEKFLDQNPYRKLSDKLVLARIHEIQKLGVTKR
jgi:hypothetical protein